MTDIIHTGLEE